MGGLLPYSNTDAVTSNSRDVPHDQVTHAPSPSTPANDNPHTPPSDTVPRTRPSSPPSLLETTSSSPPSTALQNGATMDTSSSERQANSGPPPPSSKAIGKSPMHALPPTASASSTPAEEGSSSEQYQSGQPRKVLHIFSGAAGRIDGFAAMMLDLYDVTVVEYDTLISAQHDLTNADVLRELLSRIQSGEFYSAIIGTPCSTFSVARIRKPGEPDDEGPPQVRNLPHVLGMPGVPDWCQRQLDASNALVEATAAIARAMHQAGGSFIIENPVKRSDASKAHYRAMWASHASLWDHPAMISLRKERWSRLVDFPQCAFGFQFQKLTTFMYSSDLEHLLQPLGHMRCTHNHKVKASGLDYDGKWRSALAAAYPGELNAFLALALSKPRAITFRVGSKRPHAPTQQQADQARPSPRPQPTSASIRRLEPELDEALQQQPFPESNIPPDSAWVEPPLVDADRPPPLTTAELMPAAIQQQLRDFRIAIKACFDAARRGRWKWARDHRPSPLFATEDECLLPAARGYTWEYNKADHRWHPVQPSSWPDSPPATELNAVLILQYAIDNDFPDMEIVAYMVHGYPGPELEHSTVLGPPHVGTLKACTVFEQLAQADRDAGWTQGGYSLPPVWPMRADPMNIVFRNEKPRMTIDKTMELILGVPSYNDSIDLETQLKIDYVSLSMLAKAAAIMRTADAPVKFWGFDLKAYFRKTGKQRADIWMSGFVHADGFGKDERVQFGQREAPVLTGRQSCYIVWAIRNELRRIDELYPSTDPIIRAWMDRRAKLPAGGFKAWQLATLSYVLMYVDDVGAVSFNDLLYNVDGTPVESCHEDPVTGVKTCTHVRRAQLHYQTALAVIRMFGHTDAAGKGVPPADSMVFLGVTMDIIAKLLSLSHEKCIAYCECISALIDGRQDKDVVIAPAAELASLMHKLLHASSVIPLGRQHLVHIMRANRSTTRLAGGAKALGAAALRELNWWKYMLHSDFALRGVPLAYRATFPEPMDEGVIAPYSDASREQTSPAESGYGAWAIVGTTFVYVEGRWSLEEVRELDINSLELAAMNIGSFTIMAYAKARGFKVSHLYEFTDNTAAEHSAERGKPKSSRLGALIEQRYSALLRMGVSATAERVTSVDNDVADALSRSLEQRTHALRQAAAAGYKIVQLQPLPEWRDLSEIINPPSGK